MGQKVHPYGFRLGIIRKSHSRWFAEGKVYAEQLLQDLKMRKFIMDRHRNAGISEVLIERTASNINVTVRTAKPGLIIGRGGRDVDQLRQEVERLVGGRVRLNVEETPNPDINAQLIAEGIVSQIERRISHRRAMQQSAERAMRMGAKGVRVKVSGRIGGAEIARSEGIGPLGRVPLHTLRADVEYGLAEARTPYGRIGVKVWVYKGEILPPRKGEKVTSTEGGVTTEDWERVAAAARQVAPPAAEAGGSAATAPVVAEVAAEPVAEPAPVEAEAVVVEEAVAEAAVVEEAAAPEAGPAEGDTQNVDA